MLALSAQQGKKNNVCHIKVEPLSLITNENVDADFTRMPFIEVE